MTTAIAYRPRVVLAGASSRRSQVGRLLVGSGYEVWTVDDGACVVAALRTGPGAGGCGSDGIDAVLLGLDLTAPSALDICRQLARHGSPLPVAVLAVDGGQGAAVHSLNAGADDHLDVAIDDAELVARVRALVRRSPGGRGVLQLGDLRLDRTRRTVTRGGERIELTLTEHTILELLLRNIDVVMERATIYELIWGVDLHDSSKALDVHVGGLRRKLERHGGRIIHTVRGVGYVLRGFTAAGL